MTTETIPTTPAAPAAATFAHRGLAAFLERHRVLLAAAFLLYCTALIAVDLRGSAASRTSGVVAAADERPLVLPER